MFWPGTAKLSKALRKPAKSRARLTASMAPISSLASWPVHFRASRGRPAEASCGASLMTGPRAVSRTVISVSNHQRTPIVSLRWPISESGRSLTSKRSLEAALMLVPPQAIDGLRPMANTGSPGPMRPTAWWDGDLRPTTSQTLGTKMPR